MGSSLIPCVFLLSGFILMAFGAHNLIKGAIEIAEKFSFSKVLIGTVLLGFGTSAPEFFTSFYSASVGEGVLAGGNVIGSNIFNSSLVMGTCLIFPFVLSPSEKSWQNIIFLLLPSILVVIFGNDLFFSKLEGFLFLIPLPIFLYLMVRQKDEKSSHDSLSTLKNINLTFSFFWVFIGSAMLYLGSNLTIKASLQLVSIFNLSKGFTGAVILAAGTGLPELVTTIVAGFRREISLAFGNIVGSNALNVFAVLGGVSILFPFKISKSMAYFSAPALLGLTLFGLAPLMFFSNKYFIKIWALVLFIFYLGFTYISF